jgi:hypothetical protein
MIFGGFLKPLTFDREKQPEEIRSYRICLTPMTTWTIPSSEALQRNVRNTQRLQGEMGLGVVHNNIKVCQICLMRGERERKGGATRRLAYFAEDIGVEFAADRLTWTKTMSNARAQGRA